MHSDYTKYIAIILPYSISVSTLYLFGYWGVFDVNVFEYIGLGDILKTAISQLTHYGSFVLLGAITASLFVLPVMSNALPAGGGADLPEAKFVKRYWRFFALILVLGTMYIALFTNHYSRWFVSAMLISPIVFIVVTDTNFLKDVIDKESIRIVVLNSLVTIILFAYGWGAIDANAKKQRESCLVLNGEDVNLIYIGRAGGSVFFWDNNFDETMIYREDKVHTMQYSVEPKKGEFEFLIKNKE